jgi:hypothetical protein
LSWCAAPDYEHLLVHANPAAAHEQGFDLRHLAQFATVIVDPDGTEHVTFSDGTRRLQIDVLSGSLINGPVRVQLVCNAVSHFATNAAALAKLASLVRHRRFVRSHFPQERCVARWIKALRVHDARCAGASQREIALALYGTARVQDEWHSESDAMRANVRRLIAAARCLAAGSYRTANAGSLPAGKRINPRLPVEA